jgi:hypothetical protein
MVTKANTQPPKPSIDTKIPVPKPREVPGGEMVFADFSDGLPKPEPEKIRK